MTLATSTGRVSIDDGHALAVHAMSLSANAEVETHLATLREAADLSHAPYTTLFAHALHHYSAQRDEEDCELAIKSCVLAVLRAVDSSDVVVVRRGEWDFDIAPASAELDVP